MTPAADTVDPNTAPWASLARLPGIGPSRAQAICDYRQAYAADHGPAPAFATAADLAAVPGIGEVTVERIAPYLAFGAAAALRGEAP
ncbi:MAG: helix-hairpin-helix domain-containing protein [Planctomycetes bacterium]|nr:helix-hairpin-helix domain-containing protein [Planctomycetota bacterium]